MNTSIEQEKRYKNLRIKESIFQEMGEFCYQNDISLARAVEAALMGWLDEQYDKVERGDKEVAA